MVVLFPLPSCTTQPHTRSAYKIPSAIIQVHFHRLKARWLFSNGSNGASPFVYFYILYATDASGCATSSQTYIATHGKLAHTAVAQLGPSVTSENRWCDSSWLAAHSSQAKRRISFGHKAEKPHSM